MLIIVQIVLAIFAWKNGWRWHALIPLAVGIVIGVMFVVALGAQAKGFLLIGDLTLIGILIYMICSPRIAKPIQSVQYKPCPSCAENIMLNATVCRFCGRVFSTDEVAQSLQVHTVVIQHEEASMHLMKLKSRKTVRVVFGSILAGIGGLVTTIMMIMLILSEKAASAKYTAAQIRISAIFNMCLFGLLPLAFGIIILYSAQAIKRLILAEQNRPTEVTSPSDI